MTSGTPTIAIMDCQEGQVEAVQAIYAHASIALHAALGFRRVGTLERVGRKFGRWVDTVLMQRELEVEQNPGNETG